MLFLLCAPKFRKRIRRSYPHLMRSVFAQYSLARLDSGLRAPIFFHAPAPMKVLKRIRSSRLPKRKSASPPRLFPSRRPRAGPRKISLKYDDLILSVMDRHHLNWRFEYLRDLYPDREALLLVELRFNRGTKFSLDIGSVAVRLLDR